MIEYRLRQFFLGGTDIHHDFIGITFLVEQVQHASDHHDRRAHGNGHEDDVAFPHTFLQRDHPVHDAQFLGRGRGYRIGLDAQYAAGKAATAQVNGHRSADQTGSDNA